MHHSRSRFASLTAAFATLALLSACGGGGKGSTNVAGGGGSGIRSTPTPSPTSGTCSLDARKQWAQAQINEWYLFPETLPGSINSAAYPDVDSFIDALTANARAQRKDRYFTYLTSITEEEAYYRTGSSAGYGFRLALGPAGDRIFITESFEGGPALAAGIDRGSIILAIGTTVANLRTVSDIVATEGSFGLNAALGPAVPGTTRLFRVVTANNVSADITLTAADFSLQPVSPRYGVKVIEDRGRKVGYINLRTFISTAETPLRNAFAAFRAQGITDVIVDLRYNGGGLVTIADLLNDLMAADRTTSTVANYLTFRPSKSSQNETTYFTPQPQSIAPTRVAFIGTSGTASASELVMNTFIPYLGNRAALIGSNTYGKPVGQIAIDRPACDDRLRVIAFALENANHQGAYYDGIAPFMGATCQAADETYRQLGDPDEASTRAALDFLAGRACAPISASVRATATASARTAGPVGAAGGKLELIQPERPTTPQREVPGFF